MQAGTSGLAGPSGACGSLWSDPGHLVQSPSGYSQLGEAVTAQVGTPTPELTFLAEP